MVCLTKSGVPQGCFVTILFSTEAEAPAEAQSPQQNLKTPPSEVPSNSDPSSRTELKPGENICSECGRLIV